MRNRILVMLVVFCFLFSVAASLGPGSSSAYASANYISSSKSPEPAETDVSVSDNITFYFTEDMDEDSVDEDSVYLTESSYSGDEIDASVSYNTSTDKVTISPDSDLDNNTKYFVHVTNDVETEDGDNISDTSWYFTTGEKDDDNDSELITDRNPDAGDDDAAVSDSISFYFSKDMDKDSIDEDSVYLTKSSSSGSKVEVNVSYSTSSDKVTINPDSDLEPDTKYYVHVTDDIKTDDGDEIDSDSWYFTTEADESTNSKWITDRSPDSGDEGVAGSNNISFYFKKDMDADTVNDDNIYLSQSSYSGSKISAAVSYNSSTGKVTINPYSDLASDAKYYVHVTDNVKEEDGDEIDSAYWYFTTEDEGGTVAIINYQPTNGASDVAVNSSLACTFSGALNSSTVTSANVYLVDSNNMKVNCTVTYNSSLYQINLTPKQSLSCSTQYIVRMTNIEDAGGNSIKQGYWWFTTAGAPAQTPKGTSTAPIVKLNGKYLSFTDAKPYIKNQRTMLPFRTLLEALGAQVTWDQAAKKITATLNGNKVELYIGKKTAYKNGKATTLDAAPELLNNRTMIPLRFASEALGVNVSYDSKTYTVILEN